MSLLKALILGVLQGLSEFLPISSSGHLVIAEHLMNFTESGLAFEVFVHSGSLLAVAWVFHREIVQLIKAIPAIFQLKSAHLSQERKSFALLNIYLLIASIPAAVLGLAFEKQIEIIFENHLLTFAMLFVTGLIVWSSRYAVDKRKMPGVSSSFLIGCAQAFAILPGISRSGSTIVTGLWLGIPRETAAKFSFLMAVPVILGATLLKARDIWINPLSPTELRNLLLASLAALFSSYLAIRWLLSVIRRKKLEWFGVYCMVMSLIGLIAHLFN